MPTITRIYRTGSQRHYTIALDCGHKYVVENAMVKRDQLYVGKGSQVVCIECGPPRLPMDSTDEQDDAYLNIQDLLAFTREHLDRLEAANDPHMTHERMVQADSAIQAALKRLNDIAEALRNRRPRPAPSIDPGEATR